MGAFRRPVECTITSWPKQRAGGSTILIRFQHTEHSEGEKRTLHAVMECAFRQTMTPAG